MKVRDLKKLLDRFDPNTPIDGHTLSVLIIQPTGHIMLVREQDRNDLLELAPNFYKSAW